MADEQSRRQQVAEFLEHAKKRREDFAKQQAERRGELEQRTTQQLEWAGKQTRAEDALVEQKRAEFEEWRKKQKEKKAEIEVMLKQKQFEQQEMLRKRNEAKEVEDRKKRYMKELRYTNSIKMAKEKREKIAKDAKDFALQDAEHDYRRDTEHAQLVFATLVQQVTEEARAKRGVLDATVVEQQEKLALDIKEQQSKLFKEEKVAEQKLLHDAMVQEQRLRALPGQLRDFQRKQEVIMQKHRYLFNKKKTELEVQRSTRQLGITDYNKKTLENIDETESLRKEHVKQDLQTQMLQLEVKLRKDRELAYQKEKEILQMDLTEAFGLLKNPDEDLDDD